LMATLPYTVKFCGGVHRTQVYKIILPIDSATNY